jgi:hypothetical protein
MNEIQCLPSGFVRVKTRDGLTYELSPDDVRKIVREYELQRGR